MSATCRGDNALTVPAGCFCPFTRLVAKKAAGVKKSSETRMFFCFAAELLISGYGVWVLVTRDFLIYLFLKSEFVFLDYSESPVLFYLDYPAVMGLCIFVSHYLAKLCAKMNFGKPLDNGGGM